jgi:hypothetical protein
MANQTSEIVLSTQDLREVTGHAAASAQEVLEIFERAHPADSRPRDAIDAAWTFARGGERGQTLRDSGWAAHKAAHAARAAELMAGDDRAVGADHLARARRLATPVVVDVLSRYHAAPPGGGRVGELLRDLDAALRGRS